MKTLWVLMWRYPDGSASMPVRAYYTMAAAGQDLEFMKKHADGRNWAIHEVEFIS